MDYTTAAGQVRLLIADTAADPLLDYDQVAGFLARWGVNPTDGITQRAAITRAAADALDTIATSEALISKVIRTQDLQTNGAQLAQALHAQATSLRTQARELDADEPVDGDGFGVLEFSPYPPVL